MDLDPTKLGIDPAKLGLTSIDPDELLSKARGEILGKIGVEDDKESKDHCASYGDKPSQMTGGRLLARFLSRFSCYYPKKTDGPDLDQAWAHYEHNTLPRIFADQSTFVRAPLGERERPTKLYPLWSTPTKSLVDFGVSVRMYFSTLLAISFFFALAGVLNLPLITYFWKETYSEGTQDQAAAVRGSAVCVDTQEVFCIDCYDFMDADQVRQNIYAQKNDCNFEDWLYPGILSWGASILMIIQFGFAFFWLQRKAEVVFDEEVQTASDYSLKINNPPPDAVNPDEWKDFLSQFGPVSYITVAVDNAALLSKLVNHRKTRTQLARYLPPDCDIWDAEQVEMALANIPQFCPIPNLFGAHGLWKKLRKLQSDIIDLSGQNYRAVSVFVTFDTERAQRNALHCLTPSKLSLWRKRADTTRFDYDRNQMIVEEKVESSALPSDLWQAVDDSEETKELVIQLNPKASLEDALTFRGKHVVNVREASEPNDVRWTDIQVNHAIRFIQYTGTTLAVLWFMSWSAFFISELSGEDSASVVIPIFITVGNILVPKICDFINKFESHSTEGARQASVYVKVALFRWFNSGIALLFVMGFTNTISFAPSNGRDNLNQAVYNLIYAEMFTIPIIKLVDIMGIVRKHILAPRAQDQDEMNSYFVGGRFELAERYTDATKVIFVSLFYSAILPSSLFLGAIALLIHFAVAKFCILRIWRPSPDVGASLSSLSRNYFFSMALLIHVVMSAYWWSGYPFDNLCFRWNDNYQFCNQDFLRSGIFPPLPRFQPEESAWMSESQATITALYSWTAVFMIFIAVVLFLKENIVPYIESIFKSTYEPDGADQKISFSSVKHLAEVMTYVPQLRVPGFSHPLLACDVSEIDSDVIGWKDEPRGHHYHSLFVEASQILGRNPQHIIFSQIKQWEHSLDDSKK